MIDIYLFIYLLDGVITDMDATVRMIVELSSYPLSIVIVGVGNADFTNMNILDGDEVPLQVLTFFFFLLSQKTKNKIFITFIL